MAFEFKNPVEDPVINLTATPTETTPPSSKEEGGLPPSTEGSVETVEEIEAKYAAEAAAQAAKEVATTEETKPVVETTETKKEETPNVTLDPAKLGEEYQELEPSIPMVAQLLADSGLLKHIPEDVDLDNFGIEAYKKTIKYNQDKLQEEAFEEGGVALKQSILNRLSPLSQKIVTYNLDNPNASDDEIKSLTSEISQGEYLKQLTVENHAEKIVREYYKEAGWTSDEITTKVDALINSDTLDSEATILKPKLDAVATKIATKKMEESNAIKQYEDGLQTELQKKVVTQIKTGNLNGVELDKGTAQFLFNAVMNNEVPVEMGNRTIHMGYAEALMRHQKYQGNIENVMLSLIVLKDGAKAIEKYYAQKARNTEVVKQVREVKFKNTKQGLNSSGSTETASTTTNTGFKFKVK